MTKLLNKYKELTNQYGFLTATKLLSEKLTQKLFPPKNDQVFFSPWNISLEERLYSLTTSDKKKVVFFYPAADQGTFRYRVYNFWQVINKHLNTHVASYFYANEIDSFLSTVDDFDLLIVCRFDWSEKFQRLVDRARDLGVKVIYDTDDLVFDIDYLDLIKEQLELSVLELPIWRDIITRNHKAASLADEFLCTNNFLAEKISKKFDKPVSVIPNFLNDEQVEFAETFEKPESDKFWLGYFSGTKSHNKDFALIEPSLVNVMEANPDINLRVMGHVKISDALKKYEDRIEQFAFQDFINYLGVIGTCDLVLVPLVVNDFTDCKSELKFFEAGIIQVPIIASPSYIYQLVINEKENGWIADIGEWEARISEIYKNQHLLGEVSKAAHHTASKNYFGQTINTKIENFLNDLMSN